MDMERLEQECCPSPVSTFSAHANIRESPPAEPPSTIEYRVFYRCLLLDVELLLMGKGGGEEEMRQKKAKQKLDYWFVTLQI